MTLHVIARRAVGGLARLSPISQGGSRHLDAVTSRIGPSRSVPSVPAPPPRAPATPPARALRRPAASRSSWSCPASQHGAVYHARIVDLSARSRHMRRAIRCVMQHRACTVLGPVDAGRRVPESRRMRCRWRAADRPVASSGFRDRLRRAPRRARRARPACWRRAAATSRPSSSPARRRSPRRRRRLSRAARALRRRPRTCGPRAQGKRSSGVLTTLGRLSRKSARLSVPRARMPRRRTPA